MAINTYSLVKNFLPSLLDVPTAALEPVSGTLDNLFTMAEDRAIDDVMDRGGVRAFETSFLGTVSTAGTVAFPSDLLEFKHLYIDTAPAQWLERKDPEWVYRNYPTRSANGKPKFFAGEASSLIFGPTSDTNYTIRGIYYARPTSVVGTATTFTGVFASNKLLLFAAAVESEVFLKRMQHVQLWEARYAQELERIIGKEMRERWSGSRLRVTPN